MKISEDSIPLLSCWIGVLFGIFMGIFLVVYLDIQDNLDRFCFLGIVVMGFQFFGAVVGGTWGKPSLRED